MLNTQKMTIKSFVLEGAAAKPIALDLRYDETGGHAPVIIYAHGFNGFKDWGGFALAAEALVKAGFTVVNFNFSHNGTTPEKQQDFTDLEAFGNNNYSKQLTDLKIVTNWVCDEQNENRLFIDKSNISLIGHSMGGGIAILYASEDVRIKKLVTWAAISECKTPWGSWPLEKLEQWRRNGVQFYTNTRTGQHLPLYYQLYLDYVNNAERFNIENAIKKLLIPVLICHGENDISVPVENAFRLQQWQPGAELFILDTNHVFDRVHPWLSSKLPAAMDRLLEKTKLFLK